MTPVIGITLDSENPGGYSNMPWYALRRNYCDCVARAGGLPVALPHIPDLAACYLDLIDGLIVTGGDFDVDPALYGDEPRREIKIKADRTAFELAAIKGALERDLPILGICGGQQLLNVALGGGLIQHIPDEVKSELAHEQPNPRTEAGHHIVVEKNSLLYAIIGDERVPVNSAHHQAVRTVGNGVAINARSDDGLIEGIEDPKRFFCLGVQWHPEYEISVADTRLFAAFVDACRRSHTSRT